MKTIYTKTLILYITFFVTLCFNSLSAQNSKMEFSIPTSDVPNTIDKIPELDSVEISKSVSYFIIENNLLKGKGSEILKDYINSSKFFVLGENHFSTEISKLTKSLAPVLEKSGYKGAALEVGPISAEKLKELSRVPDSTEANLKAFNNKYLIKSAQMTAIPFFYYVPDAGFLEEFAKTDMEIFGVDQENMFSYVFLGDEMVKSKLNAPNYKEIKAAWEKAKQTIEGMYENPKVRKLTTKMFTHPDYQEFEKMFSSDDLYAQNVIRKLHETWYIYDRAQKSHGARLDYIRSNFMKKYNEIEKKNENARYFIKVGYRHASKSGYSFGWYDIGNLTQEIAEIEGVKSTNVVVPRATYNGKDYSGSEATFLLKFHKKDQWTIIDLKKLREDLNSQKFQIITHSDYQGLNRMIQGFDLMLIPPADEKPEENW